MKVTHYRQLATTLLLFFIFINASAQKVSVISSTKQPWSGGVAGRSGARYSFSLGFSSAKSQAVPDSIWIEDEVFPLKLSDATHTDGNMTSTATKRARIFQININLYHDRYAMPGDAGSKPHGDKVTPPVHFDGIALVSWTYKGKKKFYEIKRLTNTLQAANYP